MSKEDFYVLSLFVLMIILGNVACLMWYMEKI